MSRFHFRLLAGAVMLSWLSPLLANFTPDLNQRVDARAIRDTGIYQIVGEKDGKEILGQVADLPRDARLTFVPAVKLIRPIIRNSEGRETTSAGNYFGSIVIDPSSVSLLQRGRIRDLNRQRIFVYEWSLDKEAYLRQVFDIAPLDKRVDFNGERFEWDRISTRGLWTTEAARIVQTYGRELLDNPPSDIDEFCPNYQNLNTHSRTAFWIHLLNSIAKRESAFDPLVGNDESHFGNNNQGIVSRGLLQISFSSMGSRAYRNAGCDVRTAEDLHDVSRNLQCGVAVFTHWARTDDCISCRNSAGQWRGIARYWSTLRERYQVSCSICSSGVANIGYKEQIIEETSKTPSCQL